MRVLKPVPNNPKQMREMAESFLTGKPILRTIQEGDEPEQFDNTFHYEIMDDISEQKE